MSGDTATVAIILAMDITGSLSIVRDPWQLPEVWFSGRTGSCTNSGPLDLGALDLVGQADLSSEKVLVVVSVFILSPS